MRQVIVSADAAPVTRAAAIVRTTPKTAPRTNKHKHRFTRCIIETSVQM